MKVAASPDSVVSPLIEPTVMPGGSPVCCCCPKCCSTIICPEVIAAEVGRRGEILVAPVTDVGWTPYFSMIAGLVTDLGSAVSHGAVIAREYGLPCVVNSRFGTRLIKTGDRLKLDGDNGVVEILS